MYWFRGDNPLAILPWILAALLWFMGGWLLASHAFHLERRERMPVGFGLGVIAYLFFDNILGRWIAPDLTYSLSALLVLLVGLAAAWWDGKKPFLDRSDLAAWPQFLVMGLLVVLFVAVGRGLAIFDDRKNLSIISLMAAGDIPPHFYMNSADYFAYHYGSQLLGSSLMRIGDMFPWSAFDLEKAIWWGYGIILSALLGMRLIKRRLAGLTTAFILVFASTTRYLLLLFPASFLNGLNQAITLQGTSAAGGDSFSEALRTGWVTAGGPPTPYPFAFLNGFGSNYVLAHAGTVTLSIVIFILFWLTIPRQNGLLSLPINLILFSVWALAWETSYALFAIGLGVIFIIALFQRHLLSIDGLGWLFLALVCSVPLVLVQGGTLTEFARSLVADFGGVPGAVSAPVSMAGFALRWPPALVSAHLGSLPLNSWPLFLVALLESGPALWLAPWITIWGWKKFRQGAWLVGVMVISSWVGFLIPMFLIYQVDRDITRLSGYALTTWTLLLAWMVWEKYPVGQVARRSVMVVGLALMCLSGLVVGVVQLSAIRQPVTGLDLNGMDAQVTQLSWDQLPQGAEVFDPIQWRAVAVTGRLTRATDLNYDLLPGYRVLYKNPTVAGFLSNGYDYVYVDENWWEGIPPMSQAELSQGCVKILAEATHRTDFRRLLDLTGCREQTVLP